MINIVINNNSNSNRVDLTTTTMVHLLEIHLCMFLAHLEEVEVET